MHSVIYCTKLLRKCGLELPKHTFYVDNIFVYQPLPYVKTMYYMDLDLYRYFIGRADQSVNEKVMVGRVDQQVRVTRLMIDAHDLRRVLTVQPKLGRYMRNYLAMMMTISSIFLIIDGSPEALGKKTELWEYLRRWTPGSTTSSSTGRCPLWAISPATRAGSCPWDCTAWPGRSYKFN